MIDYTQDPRDAPPAETVRRQRETATRELPCDFCPVPIAAGEAYRRELVLVDGEAQEWLGHARCLWDWCEEQPRATGGAERRGTGMGMKGELQLSIVEDEYRLHGIGVVECEDADGARATFERFLRMGIAKPGPPEPGDVIIDLLIDGDLDDDTIRVTNHQAEWLVTTFWKAPRTWAKRVRQYAPKTSALPHPAAASEPRDE